MSRTIEINENDVIKKRYKIRRTGAPNGRSIETSIPPEVFEREARRYGMTVSEAIEKLRVVWHYNSFSGLHLEFEKKEE